MNKIKITDETLLSLRMQFANQIFIDGFSNTELSYNHENVDTVYHYSDIPTLISIIENQCLWASNAYFLNDTQEFRHGVELIKEIVMNTTTAANKLILDEIRKEIDRIFSSDRYVVCFSKNGDLLSQWRAYANNGKGISIGFKKSHLRSCFSGGATYKYILYDLEKQKQTVQHILNAGCNFFSEHEHYFEWAPYRIEQLAAVFIIELLEIVISSYKDETYSEEKEYRLEHLIMGFRKHIEIKDIKFRSNNDRTRIIPYLEIETEYKRLQKQLKADDVMPTLTVKQLPIQEIIIGPALDFDTVSEGLKLLLHKNNYLDVVIRKSKISYRG